METANHRAETGAFLAIETSVPDASIALWCDGEVIYQKDFTSDRNHNSMVFEPLAEALDLLGERTLDAVLVGTGPGSYSGVRTGIAAGQGVALTHGCPAVGLGSLAATPCSRAADAETVSLAIGDARRGLYFLAEIDPGGEAAEPELMDVAEFQQRLQQSAEANPLNLFTLDDPAAPWLDGMSLPGQVTRTRPQAQGLIGVWLGLSETRRAEMVRLPLAPCYLRPPFTSKAKPGHPLLRTP
ncbi:tRNA (adenosine(37)-N6)-threonylcarbamoyltransferase complex dimerization subunit type 1 TsaB [Verrucomicrobiaceae bacterium 5K15]|uniref:tRNA (Adenosine(37)-N6)-threonylcarbamoyltransferase complex dimerization subunit type 1 TsaB n=1 Tax=Oceaniferula flava TaxID=2800421 RepID=A0AAE2SCX9_9BACT|nr:tRNA (adenosine(37)-N6)-threonylcarbamoyltransferase complex dimerization subunit type 1 TsaB [Oceaniferula flavus]MBK1855563.1 tRNA (adenosine(37)-N6)-threonylcarbamoyltransferase complex dimerization subunit type 1 TsaB [Oceaniferula flavus]MBM1136869.1 tRNA (adenosine(37)-N6)-threonylcarbamoyltransferase complex dimerization subunit type 1 TsaB [Oceaniferula flavus]